MTESIVLGAVQGIAEWLPVSSEGIIFLVKTNLFGGGGFEDIVRMALFLHLGTFAAALVYFRKDVGDVLSLVWNKEKRKGEALSLFWFLAISTLISGLLGYALLRSMGAVEDRVEGAAPLINIGTAILLIVTGALQMKRPREGMRNAENLRISDGVILGVVQAFSVLPGLSRSGLTVSALLLRSLKDTEALRLSFLMSLPIVLGGNILLNADGAYFTSSGLAALAVSFLVGYATIHVFLKIAQKVNFSLFLFLFAGLLLVSALL